MEQKYFYVLATKFPGRDVIIHKVSFDRATFLNIPEEFQDPKFHPFVTKNANYRKFIAALAKQDDEPKKQQGFRNIRFEIWGKNKVRTEESNSYLNDELVFTFKNQPLTSEELLEDDLNSTYLEPASYTGAQLMKIFSKF